MPRLFRGVPLAAAGHLCTVVNAVCIHQSRARAAEAFEGRHPTTPCHMVKELSQIKTRTPTELPLCFSPFRATSSAFVTKRTRVKR